MLNVILPEAAAVDVSNGSADDESDGLTAEDGAAAMERGHLKAKPGSRSQSVGDGDEHFLK